MFRTLSIVLLLTGAATAAHAVDVYRYVDAQGGIHYTDTWVPGSTLIKVDHRLIRSGPYRFVRHPIYTAMLGMFAGTAVVSGQLHAAAGLAMAGFAYWRKIRLEEANLRKAFGPAYDAYRRATGSLVPRLLKVG